VFGKNCCDIFVVVGRVPLPLWYGVCRFCFANRTGLRGGVPVACAAGMPGSRRRVASRLCWRHSLAARVNNRSPLRRGDPAPSRAGQADQPSDAGAVVVPGSVVRHGRPAVGRRGCVLSRRTYGSRRSSARGRTSAPGPDAPRSTVGQARDVGERRAGYGTRASR
jgi:hypothetical protein